MSAWMASPSLGGASDLAALLAYLLLALLLLTAWRGRLMGLLALAAVGATVLWALRGVLDSLALELPAWTRGLAELGRFAAWGLFLTEVLALDQERRARRHWRWLLGAVLLPGGLFMLGAPELMRSGAEGALDQAPVLGAILFAILGLLLVEQLYRNRLPARRWEIKHLCLGLGAVFAYDLFVYSDALLMQRIDPVLEDARGLVNALIVPLIAVSAARNPRWSLDVHVSRQVVFHTATLTGAGIYLVAMAGAGYYIRYIGGAWGAMLQIAFLFSASLVLLALLFSEQLRARMRVLLSRHFFSFKYDYREEWLRFTEALSQDGENPARAVLSALGGLVKSPGGMLWLRNEQGAFELAQRLHCPEPSQGLMPGDHPMLAFLHASGWVVDLDEQRAQPERYRDFAPPRWLAEQGNAWLVIPLPLHQELCAFAVLSRSPLARALNWEDRALLRVAGRQAAAHVAQYQAAQALMRARQFEAFNQLSAYVAHDLKNLLAQQSLLLSNAERHRHNPAFFDDVLRTLASSVERMQRLMRQLREERHSGERRRVALAELLMELVEAHAGRRPAPHLERIEAGLEVLADPERLGRILGHLVQNAQDATPPEGWVKVRLYREEQLAVIEIEDSGLGMSEDFIRERLFRPFDSTKGLTGMGIGVFESREFARLIGGDLVVRSRPGRGTLFRVLLPRAECASANPSVSSTLAQVAS